jgi:hypothetical protein
MNLGEHAQHNIDKINYRKNLTPDLAIFRV